MKDNMKMANIWSGTSINRHMTPFISHSHIVFNFPILMLNICLITHVGGMTPRNILSTVLWISASMGK